MARLAGMAAPLGRAVPTSVRRAGLGLVGSVVGARTEDPVVGLTFDDGPDPVSTDAVLGVLERRGVRATFFVLAQRAERHPDVIARTAAAGHEVALHGDEHLRLGGAAPGDVVRVVREGKRRLERVLGAPVRLFRPPGGQQSPFSYLVARATGLQVVQWSAAAEDWLDLEPEVLAARGMADLGPGGILLLHDRFEPDPDGGLPEPALDRARFVDLQLAAIAERGWQPLPVGRLLERRRPRHALWFT